MRACYLARRRAQNTPNKEALHAELVLAATAGHLHRVRLALLALWNEQPSSFALSEDLRRIAELCPAASEAHRECCWCIFTYFVLCAEPVTMDVTRAVLEDETLNHVLGSPAARLFDLLYLYSSDAGCPVLTLRVLFNSLKSSTLTWLDGRPPGARMPPIGTDGAHASVMLACLRYAALPCDDLVSFWSL